MFSPGNGAQGWLGLRYPEAYGGADSDMVTFCLFAEELARGSLSVAAAAAMQSLMGTYFVYKYGSEDLRVRYLTPALRGDLVATFALTEPNAGSDVASITTRAERRGALRSSTTTRDGRGARRVCWSRHGRARWHDHLPAARARVGARAARGPF